LEKKGYVFRGDVLEKGELCIRFSIPPTRFEEFLTRLSTKMDKTAIVRPLIIKQLESYKSYVKKIDPQHMFYVLSRTAGRQYNDNTFWFVFYTQGLTIYYPHIARPPGEFSTLRTEALYLFRTLYELKENFWLNWSLMELLQLAHSVAYGVPMEYSSLASIRGIGHIYANYLWRAFHEQGLADKIPPILSPSEQLLDIVLTYQNELKSALEQKLADRYSKKNLPQQSIKKKVQQQVKHIFKLLEKQQKGYLIDDHILTIATHCLCGQLLPKKQAIQTLKDALQKVEIDF
jgi:helicase